MLAGPVRNRRRWCFPLASGNRQIVIRRTAALGDALSATSVAAKLRQLGFRTLFQSHPLVMPLIARSAHVQAVAAAQGMADVDLDNTYERHPRRRERHFTDIWFESASSQLARHGITLPSSTNTAPFLNVSESELEPLLNEMQRYTKPWIVCGARSNSHPNRTIPDHVFSDAATKIRGTMFWCANHAPAPPNLVDLRCGDLQRLILAMACGDLYVGPDTGPMHIAAALGTPVLAVEQASSPDLHLSDQIDFLSIKVPGLDCLNCQHDPCPIDKVPPCQKVNPDWLAACIEVRTAMFRDTVSAVIPVYKPPEKRLQQVVQRVSPQVDEVVICAEAGISVPPLTGIRNARVVWAAKKGIGFGKNVNHGARESHGRWLLILNDDCYLKGDAVRHLKNAVDDDTGIVGHLLRYPDGRICHAGKYRNPGMRGWGLMNNREKRGTIQQVVEMENVTGTSILVRREAFFGIQGFDEDFHLYAEDDDLCMRMRAVGWKIHYTPFAIGTHEEAQTTRQVGSIGNFVQHANHTFEKKWGRFYDVNINTIPGTFDYLK